MLCWVSVYLNICVLAFQLSFVGVDLMHLWPRFWKWICSLDFGGSVKVFWHLETAWRL